MERGEAGGAERLLAPAAPPAHLALAVGGADERVGHLADTLHPRLLPEHVHTDYTTEDIIRWFQV